MKPLVLLTLLLGLGLVAASAQQATPQPSLPPLPPGPLIQKRAPDRAQWLIKLVPKPGGKPAQGADGDKAPKTFWGEQVVMTKTDAIMLRQTVDDKGQTWNTWCLQNLQTTVYPDGEHWIVQSISNDPKVPAPNYEDYAQSDFPGFEWISADRYAGIVEVNARRCILFRASFKAAPDALEPTTFEAYIDLNTRFPIELKVGESAHTYTFMAAPQNTLVPPDTVLSLLDSRKKMMNSAARRKPAQ